MVKISLVTLSAAIVLGFYVSFARELLVLAIGFAGFMIAVFLLSAPPFKFAFAASASLRWASPTVPSSRWALMSFRRYCLDGFPFLLSLPLGLLIVNVLWINQFPDYEADKRGDKRNWVVRLGKKRSVPVFALLFALPYLLIAAIAITTGRTLLLISFVSMPIALKALLMAGKYKEEIPKLIPANAGTILVYVVTGVTLAAALLLGH